MKKINFKELNVEVEIDKYQTADLRHEIGNALHRLSESVPMSELARKIYYSEGEIEIDDTELELARALLKGVFKQFVLQALQV